MPVTLHRRVDGSGLVQRAFFHRDKHLQSPKNESDTERPDGPTFRSGMPRNPILEFAVYSIQDRRFRTGCSTLPRLDIYGYRAPPARTDPSVPATGVRSEVKRKPRLKKAGEIY